MCGRITGIHSTAITVAEIAINNLGLLVTILSGYYPLYRRCYGLHLSVRPMLNLCRHAIKIKWYIHRYGSMRYSSYLMLMPCIGGF